MRKTLIFAVGFALVASSALSQPLGDRDFGSGRAEQRDWRHDDRDGYGSWDRDRHSRGDRAARWRDEDDDDDDRTAVRSREGASFRFQSGNARFSVQCDGRETTRACVEAALTVLDKARSLQPSPATPQTGSPQPPSQP